MVTSLPLFSTQRQSTRDFETRLLRSSTATPSNSSTAWRMTSQRKARHPSSLQKISFILWIACDPSQFLEKRQAERLRLERSSRSVSYSRMLTRQQINPPTTTAKNLASE